MNKNNTDRQNKPQNSHNDILSYYKQNSSFCYTIAMRFAVGSTSERKINTVKKILKEQLSGQYEVLGFAAKSGVPETPWDKETHDGARNRALATKQSIDDTDYCIGLESGLIERYGNVYEEAWCCIVSKDGNEFYGFSSGLKVPDYILKKNE
jgi:non-canonical (house-cleaning) NTP pyrophosphatase